MTALIAWISYTNVGKGVLTPAALYIVSDSRITWGSSARKWDAGRKVFSCRTDPHIFGYCGDVLFPSLVLAQVISAIDSGIMFFGDLSGERKHELVFASIRRSFERRHNTPDEDFSILHALRIGEGEGKAYSMFLISYDSKLKQWHSEGLEMPPQTGVIRILGSGSKSIRKHLHLWLKSDVGERSSAIFSAFCDALFSEEDSRSGGTPQIAALHQASHAQTVGFIHEGSHFLHGLEVEPSRALNRLRWRDRHFQTINPTTLLRAAGTRRFERPKGL